MGKEVTQFKKGQVGNPKGRPKGAVNKTTAEVRELMKNFVVENFPQFVQDYKKSPDPKDRARIFMDAVKFVLPTLSSVSADVNVERTFADELAEMSNEDNL